MKYSETEIKGVWLIEPQRYGDKRGYFMETFKKSEFEEMTGIKVNFVQDNESYSRHGVVRGLHFQYGIFSQAKLVRVSRGKVVDVAVDIRKDSPTFGRYVAIELSAENGRQLFVPRGFAHGFVVTGEDAQFQYKVDNEYAPHAECTIRYDDPELGIDWYLSEDEILRSDKDLNGKKFSEIEPYQL